ncbi:hypothetical protein UWK_00218 [Desulfocapsa sulfexigens DSM 10523]|uniref:Uncharacterized protein n=1 Tax=Desulfocapsa sulfexigens (strain DSM 10523 / SB164P1) TaxID=1167006 RepID=M1NAB7_DESSD|nr:hypothetical protein [Desulfocapsa sulfexigens]AGF76804.1 hypothetical protein UWK_00218 [Desulfocapsa sulfexigens DSM 10523]
MNEPTKVTKVLINKIHGKRKQDSKFWQSEFSEAGQEPVVPKRPNRSNVTQSVTFFILSFIGIGMVGYGGYFMYVKYSNEFSDPVAINPQRATELPAITTRPNRPEKRSHPSEDNPVTKKELDKAIQKALALQKNKYKSNIQTVNTSPIKPPYHPPEKFRYYQVELVNGSIIKAKSATKIGEMYTITNMEGTEFSLNRDEIKTVKKIL